MIAFGLRNAEIPMPPYRLAPTTGYLKRLLLRFEKTTVRECVVSI